MKISTLLPDIRSYTNQSPPMTDTVVIHASTTEKYYYPEHSTPHLLVANFVNRGHYMLNQQKVETSPRHFYFLNPHDTLEIEFPDKAPLQTWMILFEEKFVDSCLHVLHTSHQQLLDEPQDPPPPSPHFPNVPFDLTDTIQKQMALLAGSGSDQGHILFDLIVECSRLNTETQKHIEKLAAIKKSTREELYRRLYLAKEWIDDSLPGASALPCPSGLPGQITLDRMAAAACLNKFHFLSNFKQLFGVTPHQYLMEKRLQKAFDLLKQQRHSVTEVCALLGFESIGSFSNQFRKRFHVPPSKIPNFR
jgi:AraC family transcriptional regulator